MWGPNIGHGSGGKCVSCMEAGWRQIPTCCESQNALRCNVGGQNVQLLNVRGEGSKMSGMHKVGARWMQCLR